MKGTMNLLHRIIPYAAALCALSVEAQLSVTVSLPKFTGQKAVVELKITNDLPQRVESARAVCFLLDDQGEMVGQSAKWVIGGTKNRPALEPKDDTTFNFVITSTQPLISTNLTAKVSFSRVVLEGGKLADPKADVQIANVK